MEANKVIEIFGEFFHSVMRRKRFWSALLMAAAVCSPALGSQSVSLAWDASSGTGVAGYLVHYGSASGVYTNSVDVGNQLTASISGLQDSATYFFTVSARDAGGLESALSTEISYQVPVRFHITAPSLRMTRGTQTDDPVQFRFLGSPNQTYELQATEDLQTWTTIWYSLPLTTSQLLEFADQDKAPSGRRFYRLVVH